MKSVWHKLIIALALVWVAAPGQASAMDAGPDSAADAAYSHAYEAAETNIGAVAQLQDHAMPTMSNMTVCCEAPMPEACAVSGMAHCVSGAGALVLADYILGAPTTTSPSAPVRETPLAARAFSSDPPPPRI